MGSALSDKTAPSDDISEDDLRVAPRTEGSNGGSTLEVPVAMRMLVKLLRSEYDGTDQAEGSGDEGVLDTGKMDASMDLLHGMLSESISAMDSAGAWAEANVGRDLGGVRRIPLSGMPSRGTAGQSDALAQAKV